MLPIVIGTGMAMLGLLFVLGPLMQGAQGVRAVAAPELPPEASALDALREIEFDQATGKLSAEDYASLRASYTPRALAELSAREGGGAPGTATTGDRPAAVPEGADAAERLIARMKSRGTVCSSCGPRPETDAIFCSDCGRYLSSACLRCGAAVESAHARFCGACGEPLAA